MREIDEEYECIGLPKDIEALEGFPIKDNKMLGNEHIYWKQTARGYIP